jgi:capsule polysaccharide export protein KpsC/LpsZ
MEKDAFAEECIVTLRTAFPVGANIKTVPNDDLIFDIDWLLHTDPDRPKKHSRLTRFIIPSEVIEDYDFSQVKRKLELFIQDKLHYLNHEHEHPWNVQPPTEKWIFQLGGIYKT